MLHLLYHPAANLSRLAAARLTQIGRNRQNLPVPQFSIPYSKIALRCGRPAQLCLCQGQFDTCFRRHRLFYVVYPDTLAAMRPNTKSTRPMVSPVLFPPIYTSNFRKWNGNPTAATPNIYVFIIHLYEHARAKRIQNCAYPGQNCNGQHQIAQNHRILTFSECAKKYSYQTEHRKQYGSIGDYTATFKSYILFHILSFSLKSAQIICSIAETNAAAATAISSPFRRIFAVPTTPPAHFVKFLRAAEAARSLAFYLCFLST